MIFFFRRGTQSKADTFLSISKSPIFFVYGAWGNDQMPDKQKKHKGIQSFALVFLLLTGIVYRYPIQQNIRKFNTGDFRNTAFLG